MPLDPVFAARLRAHRRYLLAQAVKGLRDRMPTVLRPRGRAAVPNGASAAETSRTSNSAAKRARHRRAALAWDRAELDAVGVPGPHVAISEHTVPVPGWPAVRVRLYRPPGSEQRVLPAVVNFFGGAFRIGGIDYPGTDAAARRRAVDADIVVAVDYALAPEHKYPTAVHQGCAAVDWVFAQANELFIDPDRIGISGTSSGGAIAAAVTLRNRDGAHHDIRRQVLEVPITDLTVRHKDLRAVWALGIPAIVAARELRSVTRTYLRASADAKEPTASPLRAASHAGLPPALILTAEYDPLRGDGAAYGAALRAAGVAATTVRYQGVTHDAPLFAGVLPAARSWHEQVVAELRRLHE
ncbi:MAG: alpha/beta hydrolase [Microbacterium sp.]